ncbi:DUF1018 domain-containing protein [Eubacteriales bacterium OttesenSCG-928-K08]|nr:DUF1018 domain-containing protein [Eubacteriales bacterium OttesenSCG-928-K08]
MPYVDTKTAAYLTNEAPQRIRERVETGEYNAVKRKGESGGGESGTSYLIKVSSLPLIAQVRYFETQESQRRLEDCDLAGYQERYGEEGMQELRMRQRAAQEGNAIRRADARDATRQLHTLADENGITLRTLYRWMNAYEEKHLPGLMRAMARKDKGSAPSMCPAAYQFAYGLYAHKVKRTQSTIYKKLCDRVEELGADACRKCWFNEGTLARQELELSGKAGDYPPCTDPDKTGMRIPACRQTLSRILAAIPEDELTISRRGVAAWKNEHMVMTIREKPQEVNRVWFGDHHQFDCFVLDEHGKPVRPWITVWYDAATGAVVGWVISTNPNTETITEAFVNAVAHTKHSPFYGLPAALYIDNGKDYRSKTFETGIMGENDLGKLNSTIATNSVIQLFNIKAGMDNDTLHELVENVTSKTSIKALTSYQGKLVIDDLKRRLGEEETTPHGRPTQSQVEKILVLACELGWDDPARLRGFLEKRYKASHPRFLTDKNAKNCIEAMKAMLKGGRGERKVQQNE